MARKRPNSSLDTYEPLEEESSSDKENFDAPVEFIKTQMQATKGPGVVPLLFDSLWVLYVRLAHTFVPVLFCLMSNRVATTYISVLEKIKELRPDVNPQSFSLDFESAEIGAIRQVFPNTQLEGCFFHFQKAVLRYVYKQGNKCLYDKNNKFRNEVGTVAAIAFVPISDIDIRFSEISEWVEQSEFRDQLVPLVEAIEIVYIGTLIRDNKRRQPRIPRQIWNVYERVKSAQPKTNNAIEAFNGQLLRTVSASHPTIWKLIHAMRVEYRASLQKVEAYWAGGRTPRRKKSSVKSQARLEACVKRYAQVPPMDYLKAIGNNLGSLVASHGKLSTRERKIKLKETKKAHKQKACKQASIKMIKSTKIRAQRLVSEIVFEGEVGGTGRILSYLCPSLQEQAAFCNIWGLQMCHVFAFSDNESLGPKFFNTQNPVKGRFIDCLGDGNCLYRALSICLSSHEENHALLRLIVGTFLLRHQIEDWCDMNMEPGIDPVKALLPCKNSGERNKWGCGAHILAFSKLFDCNVLVYNSAFKQWTIFTPLMESAPRYSDVQDMLLPTFALINTGTHYQVIDYLL
ncbi:MULE transposase domain-containing protein [Ditylenchus destructor]|uniref:MULE transposase domain-containing protein n=1 Tax=Ditylenchus destructor TaxID=166010 RepID=A0AAD4N2L5_9BILA|nr:MULE transposase domain-containing protein [Ditylenchus destructor]